MPLLIRSAERNGPCPNQRSDGDRRMRELSWRRVRTVECESSRPQPSCRRRKQAATRRWVDLVLCTKWCCCGGWAEKGATPLPDLATNSTARWFPARDLPRKWRWRAEKSFPWSRISRRKSAQVFWRQQAMESKRSACRQERGPRWHGGSGDGEQGASFRGAGKLTSAAEEKTKRRGAPHGPTVNRVARGDGATATRPRRCS